ncbi:BQ2448_2112 [Microbotryum intermedium]|uniref:Mitochondrial import inner membrane translocase subunit TIM54 n=1 Tax=Microbotryum intermedium TaxID=269621 RepID=A0A238F5A7_9BASI|nr:BQ2448_2112 [Microbotryum intermedium]
MFVACFRSLPNPSSFRAQTSSHKHVNNTTTTFPTSTTGAFGLDPQCGPGCTGSSSCTQGRRGSSSPSSAREATYQPYPFSTSWNLSNRFVYLGIPQAVFDWRPNRPGPKMSVFLLTTVTLTGAYVYDRRECKRIQQEYIDKVKWMSEETMASEQNARKLKVYGARVPDDGELERSTKWFKRYMRVSTVPMICVVGGGFILTSPCSLALGDLAPPQPILLASGTDYIIKTGTNPGGLGRTLLAEIRARRITEASKDPSIASAKASTSHVATTNSAQANVELVLSAKEEQERLHEKEGGIILLGRSALKEYLWALKKGYNETIDLRKEARLEGLGLGSNERRKDGRWEREEELMVRELEEEDAKNPLGGPFDDVKTPEGLESVNDSEAQSPPSPTLGSLSYTPYSAIGITHNPSNQTKPSLEPSADETPLLLPPPTTIPEQPPLLFVPFSYAFGIQKWPSKLYHFFNHRSDVRQGGEYALAAIWAQTRPFHAPPTSPQPEALLNDEIVAAIRRGELHESVIEDAKALTGSPDLDFLAETDETALHFRRSYRKLPGAHEFAKRTYYKDDLPPKLKTAREISSGERAFTKAEQKYPPKRESELRKERLDKELRWRRELEGWAVVRSGSGVAWDEEKWGVGQGVETPFKVFELLGEGAKRELSRKAQEWDEQKRRKEEAREEWFRMNPTTEGKDDR